MPNKRVLLSGKGKGSGLRDKKHEETPLLPHEAISLFHTLGRVLFGVLFYGCNSVVLSDLR